MVSWLRLLAIPVRLVLQVRLWLRIRFQLSCRVIGWFAAGEMSATTEGVLMRRSFCWLWSRAVCRNCL